jgi:hypothetical protein
MNPPRLAWAAALLLPFAAAQAGSGKPTLVHTPPQKAIAGEAFTVEGLLIDGQKIDKVFLRYRSSKSEPFRTLEMEIQYGDLYRVAVPAKAVQVPTLEYFVQGVTFDGAAMLLYMSERRPARVKVVAAPAPPPRVEPLVPNAGAPDAGR